MGRLFGTDGIRGIANRDLSLRRATEVGMALAEVIRSEHPGERPAVVIGRDTRLSGDMLQSALAGGLMAGGADVVLLGVIPTPGGGLPYRAEKGGGGRGYFRLPQSL